MDPLSLGIGQRVRHYRQRHGNRSQAAVAGLCGISERYLQQIEAGVRTPSAEVLARLAGELGVPVGSLLADVGSEGPRAPTTASPLIVKAMLSQATGPSAGAIDTADLRSRVEGAWRTWQSSKHRFTQAADVLPSLIIETEQARRSTRHGLDGAPRRDIHRIAASLYGLLRSYSRRVGRLDLSLLAADRALAAAEAADDPLSIAAARWNLGHALLANDEAESIEGAKETGLLAVDSLRRLPRTISTESLEGALHLLIATADARRRRWWQARDRLREHASPIAARTGETNVHWAVFGPTNVGLHAVSIEMVAGDATAGLRLAEALDPTQLPSRERQFTLTLDQARAHDLRRDDAAVLLHLLECEDVAPEDTSRSPLARTLITGLQRRIRPTLRRQVAELATRLEVA